MAQLVRFGDLVVRPLFAVNEDAAVETNGAPPALSLETETTETVGEIIETVLEPVEATVVREAPEPVVQREEVKKAKEEKGSRFGKLFKKKAPAPKEEKSEEKEKSSEDQADASPPAAQAETVSVAFSMSSNCFL